MFHSITFLDPSYAWTEGMNQHLSVGAFELGNLNFRNGSKNSDGQGATNPYYARIKDKIYLSAGDIVYANYTMRLFAYSNDDPVPDGYQGDEPQSGYYGMNDGGYYEVGRTATNYTIVKSAYYLIDFQKRPASQFIQDDLGVLASDFSIKLQYRFPVRKNTYDDWKIVATSRPHFAPPKPKTKYVDIPGGNGSIDLTDALSGKPVYSNREGSIDFTVINDYSEYGSNPYNWNDIYTGIMEFLHGRRMYAILEDDPDYFFVGRFQVDSWSSEKDWSKITIGYSVEPFRYFVNPSALTLEYGSIGIASGENVSAEDNNAVRSALPPVLFHKGDTVAVAKHTGNLLPQNKLSQILKYSYDASQSAYTYLGQETGGVEHLYTSGGNEHAFTSDGYYRFVFTQEANGSYDPEKIDQLYRDIQFYKGGVL